MKQSLYIVAALAFAVTAAMAHQNVKNPAVKARMDSMSAIAKNMKTLGDFAKGVTPFDKDQAQAAARNIANHAGQTGALFADQAADPKSEALPLIWQNFDDFKSKANELQTLATRFSTTLNEDSDVKPAMAALGATCKSCHSEYRKK